MAGVEISYNNSVIATMTASGTETLDTEGKFLTNNIEVAYTAGASYPTYNGAYHMVQTDYTVTISLTNPINASYFRSVQIYELLTSTRYDRGNEIGSITSATGSTDVTISQSIYGIAIYLNGTSPGNPCYTGTVSVSNGLTISFVESGYLEIAVASNGTVTIDGMDYDD